MTVRMAFGLFLLIILSDTIGAAIAAYFLFTLPRNYVTRNLMWLMIALVISGLTTLFSNPRPEHLVLYLVGRTAHSVGVWIFVTGLLRYRKTAPGG